MSEQQNLPTEPLDESQDAFAPEPVKDGGLFRSLATGAMLLVASGGVVLILSGCLLGRTMGASRSARLKWEQRAQEIQRVEQAAHAQSAPAGDVTGGSSLAQE